jgi:hypothetical protein
MTAGQVTAGLTGTSICVGGGTSGAEFALIPFYGTTLSSASATLDFTATGTVSPSAAPSLIPSAGASFDMIGSAAEAPPRYRASHTFETKLRERERVDLPPAHRRGAARRGNGRQRRRARRSTRSRAIR